MEYLGEKMEASKQPDDIVTAYRLTINNYKSHKVFLTLDASEVKIKALEVFIDEPDGVELTYLKFKTSKELFIYELKQITGCIQ